MSDFSLLEEDFDRYVIGFTENHFIPADTNSPTPSEHTLGYNTFALDFAERSNRGESKIFMDHSFNLDKQKRQSVTKIHNNILDLMFELSERRKVTTPILSKSAMELHRSDSRFSDISNTSLKTASSLPLIEVQQFPPLIQRNRSMHSLSNDDIGLPDLDGHSSDNFKPTNQSNRERKNEKRRRDKHIIKRHEAKHLQALEHFHQSTKNRSEGKTITVEKTYGNYSVNATENKENDSKNVRFTIGGVGTETEVEHYVSDHLFANKGGDKWAAINEKLKEAEAIVKKKGDSFSQYGGRYFSRTSDSAMRKMSFCQCSYKERAERERMNNIRRRHSSQTNVGHLDFNKLRRQITIGRSRTTLC